MLNSILKKFKVLQLLSITLLTLGFVLLNSSNTKAVDTSFKSFTYFTGIGCPHCAKISPVLHEKINNANGLMIVEYEIYKESSNAKVLTSYNNRFKYDLAIPLVLYSNEDFDLGDSPILGNFDTKISKVEANGIELADKRILWTDFNLNILEGKAKLFTKDRVAIKNISGDITKEESDLIKGFLVTDNINEYVSTLSGNKVKDMNIEYPGGVEKYNNGIEIGAWNILWRGNAPKEYLNSTNNDNTDTGNTSNTKLSWIKISTLAITDSINPCALSVLLMMLIAIATYHPKDKKQILYSGLAFVFAVFITYFIYGLLIVKAFQLIQSFSDIRIYLYKGLGVGAIILGILELKDFFFYKPGGIGTEMPLFLRPKVQKVIARVTSPIGAFGLGMFVTLFLLPCTIGPYIILGGMLSYGDLLNALPYLSVYNLIFVLPMLVIVGLIFAGSKNIKEVSTWREKNVKLMHLIIGIIFLGLGLSMFFGLL